MRDYVIHFISGCRYTARRFSHFSTCLVFDTASIRHRRRLLSRRRRPDASTLVLLPDCRFAFSLYIEVDTVGRPRPLSVSFDCRYYLLPHR